jgi:CubicO group peptidase (beta-lactamase class C family)
LSLSALGYESKQIPPAGKLLYAMSMEHFLIATTMLVVGLFAVLSWDTTYPNQRDVMVLAPLPVRARTLFLAKVAAVASAFSLAVLILHVACGFIWPITLNIDNPRLTVPAFTYDRAIAPVNADELQAVLGQDLAPAYQAGIGPLAPGTGTGLAIGVWKRGVRRVFTYGAAKTDSLFEIGSISKTFTALILARMIAEGKVTLNQPVRELLPEDSVKPSYREITLLDLATHHSGLPSMPDNLQITNQENPYANYHKADLYEYISLRGVRKSPGAEFNYSNLGYGLLGEVLADRAGLSYPDLLRTYVTGPLQMQDTVIALSAEQRQRFLQGHYPPGRAVHAWDMDALAPAGGIRSSVEDMLTYLERQLHPDALSGVAETHKLRADLENPDGRVALAWIYDVAARTYWHDGGTRGFSSYAFFRPADDAAGIVLINVAPWPIFADLVGLHIRQRLTGEPAVSLGFLTIPASGGFAGLVRLYATYWFTMLAAGAFIFCCVLGLQGIAAQVLPRRLFLRASSFLQLAAFCLLVSVYFLQPLVTGPLAIMSAQSAAG